MEAHVRRDRASDVDETNKADWVRAALRQHEGPLTRYATGITGDPDRARDVVQDTFVRLCAEEPGRLRDHLAQWLFTVCRNRAFDLQRKERRMAPLTDVKLETYESGEPSPAAAAERKENALEAGRLLDQLPPQQREVVRLKFQNGLSYREISQVTGLTVSNVGFLIHTAIKSMRRRMHPDARPIGPESLNP
jgi:RNA polymerase sigma-70 factor (ECF subfamily)